MQHGFTRDAVFTCIDSGKDFLTFQLCDTEETRNYFPFAFQLLVIYTLKERELEVCWKVENRNQETMYFTIGGHPGFNVPILENTKQTDYKLLFQRKEALEYLLVYGNTGTADSSTKYQLPLEDVYKRQLQGRSLAYYVPETVISYITENNIYKDCDKDEIRNSKV